MQIAMKVGIENRRPDIPPDCPMSLASLISFCWAQKPASRPSFQTIQIEVRLFPLIFFFSFFCVLFCLGTS